MPSPCRSTVVRLIPFLITVLALVCCSPDPPRPDPALNAAIDPALDPALHAGAESPDSIPFNLEKAERLYQFAYACIDMEYPHKPGHVWSDETRLMSPQERHPAFYGCFDWHSAVHGHWTLVTILSRFPDFEHRGKMLDKITANITRENIQQEMELFREDDNRTFQRTYGWAWLLKLDQALREWDDPVARELHGYLEPLSELLAERFIEFLDVLNYPIRVGEHSNTAFGMSFAYDYADRYHPGLARKIEEKSREYFLEDRNCPIDWEPGGFDFLSPCLQQASLMTKVLPTNELRSWVDVFLPGLLALPEKVLTPAVVPDASDGKLAHLDGLNFSRAWCLFEIGDALMSPQLSQTGMDHFNHSYELLDADEYAGSHWLASFATYALIKSGE
ncbi:MAG: DUF2891 domain-containing protein [Bacteroidota bacterium]